MRMMSWKLKRVFLTATLASALAMVPNAQAASTGSGSILAGHPGTAFMGVTEKAFRDTNCSAVPAANYQGKDGFVFELPTGTTSLTLNAFPASAAVGIHVFFYKNPGCDQEGPSYNKDPFRTSWSGNVPTDSKWVVVGGDHGINISLSWSTSP